MLQATCITDTIVGNHLLFFRVPLAQKTFSRQSRLSLVTRGFEDPRPVPCHRYRNLRRPRYPRKVQSECIVEAPSTVRVVRLVRAISGARAICIIRKVHAIHSISVVFNVHAVCGVPISPFIYAVHT